MSRRGSAVDFFCGFFDYRRCVFESVLCHLVPIFELLVSFPSGFVVLGALFGCYGWPSVHFCSLVVTFSSLWSSLGGLVLFDVIRCPVSSVFRQYFTVSLSRLLIVSWLLSGHCMGRIAAALLFSCCGYISLLVLLSLH